MSFNKTNTSSAFTIVELLIVVVVIAILAAITIVSYNGITAQAEDSSLKSTLKIAANKVEIEKVNTESYPVDEIALEALGVETDNDQYTLTYTADHSSNTYCISIFLKKNTTKAFSISNTNGEIQNTACTGHVAPGEVALNCPTGFIVVPGDSRFGTSDFCIMKYEAKNNGSNVAVSTASGQPWTLINHSQAVARSAESCEGCHLVTEAEWMTVAANVISVPSNWTNGSVGDGSLYRGHVNNDPSFGLAASEDDSDGIYGITGTIGEVGSYSNRRTLTLTNGEVIWDLSGNVGELMSATIGGLETPRPNLNAWYTWDSSSLDLNGVSALNHPSSISSEVASWGSGKGMGRLQTTFSYEMNTYTIVKGGDYGWGFSAGVLALSTGNQATDSLIRVGFRVAR